jgi:hypothetical protein
MILANKFKILTYLCLLPIFIYLMVDFLYILSFAGLTLAKRVTQTINNTVKLHLIIPTNQKPIYEKTLRCVIPCFTI